MSILPFPLAGTMGRTYGVNADDTRRTKLALRRLGYFKIPDYGLTDTPDEAMFGAIEAFQRASKLEVDGVIKPDGPTAVWLAQALDDTAKPVAQSGTANSGTVSGVQPAGSPTTSGSSPTDDWADPNNDGTFGMGNWEPQIYDKDTDNYVYIHKPTGDRLVFPSDATAAEIRGALELADRDHNALLDFLKGIGGSIFRPKPEDLLIRKSTPGGRRH